MSSAAAGTCHQSWGGFQSFSLHPTVQTKGREMRDWSNCRHTKSFSSWIWHWKYLKIRFDFCFLNQRNIPGQLIHWGLVGFCHPDTDKFRYWTSVCYWYPAKCVHCISYWNVTMSGQILFTLRVWDVSSIHARYDLWSGAGWWWQQAQQGGADVPLPSNVFQLLLGDPEAFLVPGEPPT